MGEQRTYNRRQMLKGAGVVAALVGLGTGGGYVAWDALSGPERPPAVEAPQTPGPASLERLAASVVSGGPGKDGIPSIDEPKFVKAGQADFLDDDEPVFGLAHKGGFRAYPQQVLVWHEIVNDRVDGRRWLSPTARSPAPPSPSPDRRTARSSPSAPPAASSTPTS